MIGDPLPCAPVAPPFDMSGSPAIRAEHTMSLLASHAQHLVEFAAIRAEHTPRHARTHRFSCSNRPRRIHHHCGSRRARRQLTAPPAAAVPGFGLFGFQP